MPGLKLFVTGATGYIGGDALYAIVEAHPEYAITALVRNSQKGALIAKQYPKIKLVYGDLDSEELIEEESRKADIVCNWANVDHEGSAKAIAKGLLTRSSDTLGYYIHTSGTGLLVFSDTDRNTFGESSTKVYDDWDGLKEVTSLPDHALHRHVDKVVLAAGDASPSTVKTAIVCPPCIYGPGRGPDNQTSMQIPWLAAATLTAGHGVQVGAGAARWGGVHVRDLSNLYLLLVEAASRGGEPATWGPQGYYFCEAHELRWADAAQAVAAAAHRAGYVESADVKRYDAEAVKELNPLGALMWGSNSRARALRARKLLGWTPKHESLEEVIPGAVELEAKKLGKAPGHAKIAAGDA
ncbi:hypothetical protein MBLNU459_g0523t1 [Dothideomycetes sp. NU459]